MSLFIVYNDIANNDEDDENYFDEKNVGDPVDKGHEGVKCNLSTYSQSPTFEDHLM